LTPGEFVVKGWNRRILKKNHNGKPKQKGEPSKKQGRMSAGKEEKKIKKQVATICWRGGAQQR